MQLAADGVAQKVSILKQAAPLTQFEPARMPGGSVGVGLGVGTTGPGVGEVTGDLAGVGDHVGIGVGVGVTGNGAGAVGRAVGVGVAVRYGTGV